MGGCNGGEGEVFTGITIKDTWTKARGSGNRGGWRGYLGWWGRCGGKRQKTVIEQQ